MDSTSNMVFRNTFSVPIYSPKCCNNHNLSHTKSQFISPNSLLQLKKQIRHSSLVIKQPKNTRAHASPIIFAAQSNFLKGDVNCMNFSYILLQYTSFCASEAKPIIQTAWKVGRDGIEAGTSLVPDAVPRPIARISVAVVAGTLALFVLKSFISTAFFALAVMGLCYFAFIALNKDEGPKGGTGDATSVDDSLEEARRIMDKYK